MTGTLQCALREVDGGYVEMQASAWNGSDDQWEEEVCQVLWAMDANAAFNQIIIAGRPPWVLGKSPWGFVVIAAAHLKLARQWEGGLS